MARPPAEVLYVNGEYRPVEGSHLSALDRGFTLGDGLFETMRAHRGAIFRLDDHLARLRTGAATLRLRLPFSDDEIAQILYTTLERNNLTAAVLRLSVSRGPSHQRGLALDQSSPPTVVVRATPFVPGAEAKYHSGFSVIVASIRRNDTSPTARVKSLNYLDSVLAHWEATSLGADDALFLNTRDQVTGGTASNVFLVTARGLVTPTIASGILAGVTRRTVLDLARELGIATEECVVTIHDLLNSQEVFLTNTVIGLMPVVQIGDRPIGNGQPGPVWQRLNEKYRQTIEHCSTH